MWFPKREAWFVKILSVISWSVTPLPDPLYNNYWYEMQIKPFFWIKLKNKNKINCQLHLQFPPRTDKMSRWVVNYRCCENNTKLFEKHCNEIIRQYFLCFFFRFRFFFFKFIFRRRSWNSLVCPDILVYLFYN